MSGFSNLIAIVQGELNTLVGGDASSAIDSFNEIRAFLASFSDAEDLASVLLALKSEIVAMIPSLEGYLTIAVANQTFVSLEGYVAYTNEEKNKLASIAEGAQVNEVGEAPQDGKKYVRSDAGWVVADAKIDLFIDMWNSACGSSGTYNAETGYFELNTLTDIDYNEAIKIYTVSYRNYLPLSFTSTLNYIWSGVACRTTIPLGVGIPGVYTPIQMCYSSAITHFVLRKNNLPLLVKGSCSAWFRLNFVIKKILALIVCYSTTTFSSDCFGSGTNQLEYVRIKNLCCDINFSFSPNLDNDSMLYLIVNAGLYHSTGDPVLPLEESITITLHPDAYARAMADEEIQAALEAQPLITLASA